MPLTISAIKNDKESHIDIVVPPGENFEKDCAFIEKLIVLENDELDENDFKTLRSKPFYKVQEGVYRIIFNLFVIEKIFKGVYFLLRDVNDNLPADIKIPDLKSFFGNEFSEKILLYKILESIYHDKCTKFSGQELTNMKIDGAPDYYIRKGKNILLFESKDFLIKADKKQSFDFNIFEEEFQRILYYENLSSGKVKRKAVKQLANSIRKILKKEFYTDTKYFCKDIFIYPILLTHDSQYDVLGFNYLVNYWFQKEIEILKNEGLFIYHIRPLVVVNIDALIFHQIGLSDTIPLHDVLKLYIDQINVKLISKFKTFKEYKDGLSHLIPFSIFIDKYFHKKGINKIMPILDSLEPALFKEEFEKNKLHIN